ncbi:MAG TPA: ABC transporter permease [Candidatus Angelobacter sp.]|nr:ABC transporter permease [Candidatus Angelobacter sp.]
MTTLWLDFWSSWRQIRRSVRIAVLVAVTVSLSIGIVVAAFSVIEAELIRPLPYDHPEQLVILQGRSATGQPLVESYLHYVDIQRQSQSLASIAGFTTGSANLQVGNEARRLTTVYVTDTFFDVFGIKPILGRTFVNGENQPGRTDVVVLSFEVWQQEFGGAYTAVGQQVKIDGKSRIVVGVLPRGFRYPLAARHVAYIPLSIDMKAQARGSHWLRTVARVKSGATLQQAQTDLDRICRQLGALYPATDAGYSLHAVSLKTWATRDTASPLLVLSGAALAVFLLGCFNAAGLIVVRNIKRTQELSLRIALGASPWQIRRLVLADSLLLSAFGLAGGLLLAWLLLGLMGSFLLDSLSRGADVHLTFSSFAMAFLAALCTSLLVGVIPAIRLSKTDPNQILKDSASTGGGRSDQRVRAAVVITQTSIAFVLLVVAGIFVRLVLHWRNTQLGFSTANTFTLELNVVPADYKQRDIVTDFYQPLLDRVEAIPGVQSAGLIQVLPIQDWGWSSGVHIAGRPHDPPSQQHMAEDRFVSSGYYHALGIPLIRGRMLDGRIDTRTSQAVCLVNEAFVQTVFPGQDPLGQKIDEGGGPPCVIVGVTKSIRQDLFEEPLAEEDYPISQFPRDLANQGFSTMHLVVHSQKSVSALVPGLRKVLHDLDSGVPFEVPETMDDVLSKIIVLQRMEGWVFTVFAGLAVFLAAVGLYGLVSYEVQVSVRAIGVRMALGATRWSILNRVLLRVGTLLAIGIAVGAVALFVLRKVLVSILAMSASQDLMPIVELAVCLFLVGLASAFLPALRAASVQPTEALRST